MSTIIDLRKFRDRGRSLPALVLVDLHHDLFDLFDVNSEWGPTDALERCAALLRHARTCGLPVAFTRRVVAPDTLGATPRYPRWINGFEPQRSDMVFDHSRPSCYTSIEFSQMAEYLRGKFVMAGRLGEVSCLSTAVDASQRDHRPTFLTDALVIRGSRDIPTATMERALAHIVSFYVETETTEGWMSATSYRLRMGE